jgi:hypothetical protein
MRGDLALADQYARELGELTERAGSVNARLLGLVQRFGRLVGEVRAGGLDGGPDGGLDGNLAEIVALIPDDPRAAASAHAFLSAHRGQLAEARGYLDQVVAATPPNTASTGSGSAPARPARGTGHVMVRHRRGISREPPACGPS